MLVNTLSYFARAKVLRQTKVDNAQTFGAPSIGIDTTRRLTATRVVNNNFVGNPLVARGLPKALAPARFANAQTFRAPTIAKLTPGGGGVLSLDGTATGQFSGSALGSLALTTTKLDDIIVVAVGVEKSATAIQTVTSIDDGMGLVWTRRAGVFETNEQNLELWWAHAVAPLAANTINVHMNAATDDAVLLAFAVNGSSNLAAPFDGVAGTASGIGTGHPLTTKTTTTAKTMLIGISSSRSGPTYVPGVWPDGRDGVGYTHIANRENFGGSRQCSIGAEFRIVNAIQSGVDVDFIFPGNLDWLIVGDAIR